MPPDPYYTDTWRRHLLWSRLGWIGLGAFLACCFAAVALRNYGLLASFAGLLAFPSFLLYGVATFAKRGLECPHCRRSYFGFWLAPWNVFVNHCVHCGLPKWATGADEAAYLAHEWAADLERLVATRVTNEAELDTFRQAVSQILKRLSAPVVGLPPVPSEVRQCLFDADIRLKDPQHAEKQTKVVREYLASVHQSRAARRVS